MRRALAWVVAASVQWSAFGAWAGERQVDAFNTYLHPPFLGDAGEGIAATLLAYLNRTLAGDYHFTQVNLPRKRFVMSQLAQGAQFDGVGLLLIPEFVGDADERQFLWTKPLFADFNVLVFRRGEVPAIKVLSELKGRSFVGVLGNRYAILDELAAQGLLTKFDNNNEQSNLRMVVAGRADFTQMNRLLYAELTKDPQFAGMLSAMAQPESPPFGRRILVGRAQAALLPRLDQALAALPCDRAWRALALRYQLALAPCAGLK